MLMFLGVHSSQDNVVGIREITYLIFSYYHLVAYNKSWKYTEDYNRKNKKIIVEDWGETISGLDVRKTDQGEDET